MVRNSEGWTWAHEAIFWLNEVEASQGGANDMTDKLREAIRTLGAPVAATTEHHIALREGHGCRALDDYFAARPVEDGAMQRRAFEQGYQRGFDKAAELYSMPKG